MKKNKSLVESFNNAIRGMISAVKTEKNMKIHLVTAFFILVLSLYYRLTKLEFLIICLTVGLVLVCELFNTAVELLVDLMVDIYHPKAKKVKDVTAAAVLVSAFVSLAVGYFVFIERFKSGIELGIKWLKESPVHLTAIALFITACVVVLLKLVTRKGTPLHGGMPSGHAALAIAITTAVAFLSGDAKVTLLCLAVSVLAIQGRFQAGIHSFLELFTGGLLGFLITALLFQLIRII